MKLRSAFIWGIPLLLLFNSCQHDRLDVDAGNVTVPEVKLMRLDQDIQSITPQNIQARQAELRKKYGNFYDRYIYQILFLKGNDSSNVLNFTSDKTMRETFSETKKAFSDKDLEQIESDLEICLKRFRYFFPSRRLPQKFASYMGGFNYKTVYVDSTLAFGMEMYLGAENPFLTLLQWPRYKTRTMDKAFLVPDLVQGWMITEFDNSEPINNLLNHMIFYGKILYACDALLPDVQDSLKIGYTTAQMKTCKEFEKNYWGHLVEKNRLYDNNLKTIAEYTTEGPFTGVISKECPPRIAHWIGWQIVRSYMAKNETVTLEELMKEKDAQKILTKSKYRP